ncbi:hypothetical protein ACIQ7D_17835 [Streptomyces sp. NPDC096310]|uniref:hypothetical protein n=1 Tax=Streptomyces sp. NPDC096310 TaxID=3366082 RepID=UPI003827C614
MTAQAGQIVTKYANKRGAIVKVVVTRPSAWNPGHDWTCDGCGAAGAYGGEGVDKSTAQRSAEKHADKCRALPLN